MSIAAQHTATRAARATAAAVGQDARQGRLERRVGRQEVLLMVAAAAFVAVEVLLLLMMMVRVVTLAASRHGRRHVATR